MPGLSVSYTQLLVSNTSLSSPTLSVIFASTFLSPSLSNAPPSGSSLFFIVSLPPVAVSHPVVFPGSLMSLILISIFSIPDVESACCASSALWFTLNEKFAPLSSPNPEGNSTLFISGLVLSHQNDTYFFLDTPFPSALFIWYHTFWLLLPSPFNIICDGILSVYVLFSPHASTTPATLLLSVISLTSSS